MGAIEVIQDFKVIIKGEFSEEELKMIKEGLNARGINWKLEP